LTNGLLDKRIDFKDKDVDDLLKGNYFISDLKDMSASSGCIELEDFKELVKYTKIHHKALHKEEERMIQAHEERLKIAKLDQEHVD
jgi:hypothetical protein